VKTLEKHELRTQRKYDRFAKVYDIFEAGIEKRFFGKWRKIVWNTLPRDARVLEVGIGTGKNIPYYPDRVKVVGIDFSEGMLAKAELAAKKHSDKDVKLVQMDVTNLKFEDNTFDFVISTFVFCTVPDPISGLKEIRRVLKPNGTVIFLEHMKSSKFLRNIPLYLMEPIMRFTVGTSVLRETKKNILLSGLRIRKEKNLFSDIFRMIECTKGE